MGKIMKSGRIVIMLSGRYAGRKAVIVRNYDTSSSSDRAYPHALVTGLDRYPRRITRRMPKKKQKKMLKMKPFVKVANYTHLLPTRYLLDCKFDPKRVNKESLKDKVAKRKAREEVRAKLHDKLIAGKNQWFFTKFRF